MKKNKKQLHEALAVLLTKLSSAMDNPLLMDNYVVKALRTVLLEYKESGELYDAYKEQIQSTMESDNPWIGMLMKSIGGDASVKDSIGSIYLFFRLHPSACAYNCEQILLALLQMAYSDDHLPIWDKCYSYRILECFYHQRNGGS
ncbi:hypothetical protein [Segatella copri]|uniref:hypothetical protein n=1 Tax=Segatella copri TaxID=165179 RepID=UPI00294AFAC5|nr:hypothetical protein [Segatella copri]